jgi:hypothetical protein
MPKPLLSGTLVGVVGGIYLNIFLVGGVKYFAPPGCRRGAEFRDKMSSLTDGYCRVLAL